MSSLIQMVQDANKLEILLMESAGEVTPEIENLLAVREINLPEKVDGYSAVIKRFAAIETHYKEKAKMFSLAAKQLATAQENLEERLKYAMQELGVTELLGNDIRYKLIPTSGTLEIIDAESVPVEFKTEVVETVIDNKALKAAITAGKEITGATVKPGFQLRQFVNKGAK